MLRKVFRNILLILLVLIIIILVALPGIFKRTVVNNSKEWIGRQIELEGLKINYLTSTIRLRDFKMYELNEKDVFVQFDTLIVDAEIWQLMKKEIVLENIHLSGLVANVIQYDSTFNFTDLVTFHAITDTIGDYEESIADTTVSPFSLQLSDIDLVNGSARFVDATLDEEISLRGIDLFIPYFGWDKEIDRASGLKFNFKNGGFLQLNVDWDPKTKNLEGTVIVDSLELENFSGYSHKFLNHGMFDGTLDARLDIHRPVEELHSVKVFGSVEITDFFATAKDGDTLLGFDHLRLTIEDLKPLQERFVFDSLVINKPIILFEKYDSIRTNFGDLVKQNPDSSITMSEDAKNVVEEEETSQLYYALNAFQLVGGEFDFVDKSMDQAFKYNLSEIETAVDSINSESNWIDVIANMKLNRRGNLTAELGLDPAKPMELDLYYVITDFQLSDLNIYSTYYAGLPILYGDMYYKSETTIKDGILDSKNELIFEDVELGDQSESVIDLPLGLALFLLKDKNGDITMEVPVHGDLNEPGISVRKVVWDSFSGFVGKIAAAPFKVLGNMFGIDPKDIKDIEYAYMDAELTDKKKKQVESLLNLEGKKEDLGIELVYFNDMSKEREAIAIDMVGQKFNNKKRDYRKDKKDFEKYVKRKTKNKNLELEEACLQLVNLSKVDTLVSSLKNERINSLKNYLVSLSDSSQISFYIPDAIAPKNIGSKPIFEIKYSMKAKKKAEEIKEIDDNMEEASDTLIR